MNKKREEESQEVLEASPSFRLPEDGGFTHADSHHQISSAALVSGYEEDEGDEFEFSIVVENSETDPPITADEIFSEGKILPIYPVFNCNQLIAGDREGERSDRRGVLKRVMDEHKVSISSSSPSADDLEGIPPGTYCVWKPRSVPQSPELVRKSSSTGSSFRWKIRDLVLGRSHSDGKEKFKFLGCSHSERKEKFKFFSGDNKKTSTPSPPPPPAVAVVDAANGERKRTEKGKKVSEVDLITVHKKYYAQRFQHEAVAKGGVVGRRSFLPYKPVGFFAGVKGISWVHHPF